MTLFALLELPLKRPRLLKKTHARRNMRTRGWEYLIVEGEVARLGLSGAGAVLVVCEDTIGPERIGDAVRRARKGGILDLAALLRALRGAIYVATATEEHGNVAAVQELLAGVTRG